MDQLQTTNDITYTVHKPESTSIGRAAEFHKRTVSEHCNNLDKVLKHKFKVDCVFNIDETIVQNPTNAVTTAGI